MTKSKKKMQAATNHMKNQVAFTRYKNAKRALLAAFGQDASMWRSVYDRYDHCGSMSTTIEGGLVYRDRCNPGSPFFIRG